MRARRLPPGSTPCAASSSRPPAILNRNTPGISDTTEAKARLAKGSRSRSATGVTTAPTTRHATSAPAAGPAPQTANSIHRSAWATIPTAIGIGSIRHGMEKKVP